MNLPEDLRDFKAPVDGFQLLDETLAGVAFVVLLLLAAMLRPW